MNYSGLIALLGVGVFVYSITTSKSMSIQHFPMLPLRGWPFTVDSADRVAISYAVPKTVVIVIAEAKPFLLRNLQRYRIAREKTQRGSW